MVSRSAAIFGGSGTGNHGQGSIMQRKLEGDGDRNVTENIQFVEESVMMRSMASCRGISNGEG